MNMLFKLRGCEVIQNPFFGQSVPEVDRSSCLLFMINQIFIKLLLAHTHVNNFIVQHIAQFRTGASQVPI